MAEFDINSITNSTNQSNLQVYKVREDLIKQIDCTTQMNSINNSLDTGLLRLEITFYINNNAFNEEYIYNHLSYLAEPDLI